VAWIASVASPAYAQSAQATDEGENGSPAPYVDRLIDGGTLEPSVTSEDLRGRNTTGNLRSLVTEVSGARISSTSTADTIDTSQLDSVQQEAGIIVSGRYQTDNFGLIGLDAQLRRGSRTNAVATTNGSSWNGLLELTSSSLPLGSGWVADTALGTTSTPLIELFGRQTRFFLPVSPIMGGAVTFNAFRALEPGQPVADPKPFASLNLSIGEPGLLGGLRLTDYTGLSGLLVSGGGQLEVKPGLTAGVQAISVTDSTDPFARIFAGPDANGETPLVSSSAIVGSLGVTRGRWRIQANSIWSTRSSNTDSSQSIMPEGSAFGGSVDAVYRRGPSVHAGGIYYFGPGLTWGTAAILSNAYGGYYRFSTSSQRWRWTLNLDAIDSVDGTGSSGFVLNADTRRTINFSTAIGVNANLRFANSQSAGQALGYIDFETDLGVSRAEAGWGKDSLSTLYRVGFIQNWSLPATLPAGSRLSTQLSYQHRDQTDRASRILGLERTEKTDSFGVAVSAGLVPFKDASLDATIAYSSDASATASEFFGPFQSSGAAFGTFVSQESEAFSATVIASARLSSNWSLSGTYTDTTSSLISRFGIPIFSSPLGPSNEQVDELRRSAFRLRAAYLTLRYSVSAGRPASVVGARQFPFGGTGNLEGRVFLDANANGVRDPSEAGAAGIVVILDGVQAVRTNEAGFYRFEGIADGPHRIEVNADNLPLPWFIEAPGQTGVGQRFSEVVEIGVRTTTTLDIAASR
jgi:hypothetical protein